MSEDGYVEVRAGGGRVFQTLIVLLLIGYLVFLGVLVWQIDSNTHEIARDQSAVTNK